jgi:hypothetical protein
MAQPPAAPRDTPAPDGFVVKGRALVMADRAGKPCHLLPHVERKRSEVQPGLDQRRKQNPREYGLASLSSSRSSAACPNPAE